MKKNNKLNIVDLVTLVTSRVAPGRTLSKDFQDNGIYSTWVVQTEAGNVVTAFENLGLMHVSVATKEPFEEMNFEFVLLMDDLTKDRVNAMLNSLILASNAKMTNRANETLLRFS